MSNDDAGQRAPKRRARPTPKQRVLRKYPEAVCLRAARGGWEVWHRIDTAMDLSIGYGAKSAAVAWKIADMRIHL